jgi:hypothetical protein
MVKQVKIRERFPITLGVLALDALALVTLPFLALSVDVTPDLSAKSVILLVMFLVGAVLLFGTSVAFTGGLDMIKPERTFEPFTVGQAILVLAGFAVVGVWQLYVNQAFITPAITVHQLATAVPTTVDPTTATIFGIDAAVAEESLLGAFTIFVFVTMVYFKLGWLLAGATALGTAAAFFTWLHYYVYGTNAQALIFVFGARVVLSGVLLGTLYFSRFKEHPSASLAAPILIHVGWNISTVLGS